MTNRCFGLVSHCVQSLSRYFRSCSEPTAPLPCKSAMLWCHCSELPVCGSNTQTRSQCQSRCCSRCTSQSGMCKQALGCFSGGALLRRPRLRALAQAGWRRRTNAQHVFRCALACSCTCRHAFRCSMTKGNEMVCTERICTHSDVQEKPWFHSLPQMRVCYRTIIKYSKLQVQGKVRGL